MNTIEEIRAALSNMHRFATGQSDRTYMSIPADPKRDADIILDDAIKELETLRALVRGLERKHRRMRDTIRDVLIVLRATRHSNGVLRAVLEASIQRLEAEVAQ